MDPFEQYKQVRNRCAEISYEDAVYAVWAYSQHLQLDKFQIPSDIQVHRDFLIARSPQSILAEWDLELLIREVLINGSTVARRNRSLKKWDTLGKIINGIKKLERIFSESHVSDDNILVELVRIAHRQFIWQTQHPNAANITRYYQIFSEPTLNQILCDRLGLSVKDIYIIGLAFVGGFTKNPVINFPIRSDIEQFSEEKIRAFLRFTCKTIRELKKILSDEHKLDDRYAYSYNSLREFPLIHMMYRGRDGIACPLPTLLFWRMSAGLYYEICGDARFDGAFGESFQRYVGEVINRGVKSDHFKLLPEEEYGSKKARKRTVDWILAENTSAALFVECKSKRLSWDSKVALDDVKPLEKDIDALANATLQIYRTIHDYCNNRYLSFPYLAERKIFPLIVTLEDWYFFGEPVRNILRFAVEAGFREHGLPLQYLETMPYSICSAQEFEQAVQIIDQTGIHTFVGGMVDDPKRFGWSYASYIADEFPCERKILRNLFVNEYNEIFSGVARR